MRANSLSLTAAACRIATDQPRFWEHRLFAQVLCDEIARSKPLLLSPSLGTVARIPLDGIWQWVDGRMGALIRICNDLKETVNAKHDECFGLPGSPGNIEHIVALSRQVAAFYRQTIEWVHLVRNADVDPRFRRLTYETSFLADSVLAALENYGPYLLRQLEAAAKLPPGTKITIDANIKLGAPDLSRCAIALREVDESYRSDATPAPVRAKAGYIYILVNPSLGNLLKIGKTTRSPRDRIGELSSATGVPTPFTLAFDAFVEDCHSAEAYVHARLEKDGYRVASNREFFNVDLSTAINVVLEAQKIVSAHGGVAGDDVLLT